jgi:pimeloyl-[acyl-carrier protein] methyl ester esterase
MKPSLLLISGWAHGLDAIKPIGDYLAEEFDVQLLTGEQVLKARTIPETDYIITGSMGGLLTMELLPDSCKKLVLISSTAKFCAGEGYTCGTHEKILSRMILQLKRNPTTVLAAFYKNVHYPHSALKTDPECSHEELVAGLEYLLSSDVRDKVPKIKIPVLLLHGAEDRIIPHTAAEWLNDHLPDSRLKIFDNDGHALPAHHFDEIMDEISNFL